VCDPLQEINYTTTSVTSFNEIDQELLELFYTNTQANRQKYMTE